MAFLDWGDYRRNLTRRFAEFGKLRRNTLAGYQQLGAPEEGDVLDAKTRELISLAVAVTTRCDGCIASHTTAAIKAGATREEVAEALSVAVQLNAGAAMVYSSRVLDAYDGLKDQTPHGHA
ncbi:carboxymuconolactone decarboxylase family protein [Galactobacter valiniphilus]|jgi:AhpD family alkylhydroperoxidase|uniref:carboxymuconolactone decarboxylase family protein n=1 Tax=Galactobacter valiniphilus TaxID=2676122 RepID=UPI00281FFC2D|nr:carboxymuconolactone decarboxylase family protein [Arthrobacter sp.]